MLKCVAYILILSQKPMIQKRIIGLRADLGVQAISKFFDAGCHMLVQGGNSCG